MRWWTLSTGSTIGLISGALVIASILHWLLRCLHPNPHYIKAVTHMTPAGAVTIIESARYQCYECGRSWPAEVRDRAWKPSRLLQKFVGYDEQLMHRAAVRAAIEEEQRRRLATRRATDRPPTHQPLRTPVRRRRPHNVIALESHRRA